MPAYDPSSSDMEYDSDDDGDYEDGFQTSTKETPCKTKVFAILLPLAICIVLNLVYQVLAYFPNKRYLQWMADSRAESTTCWPNNTRLPDLLLDAGFTGESEADVWTPISDALPTILLVVAGLYIAARGRLIIVNRLLLTQGFMILLNAICENATTLPSSYGYDRCLAYLGVSGPDEVPFGLNLTGTCTAMIWSGHTMHTLLACYMFGLALEADCPRTRKPLCGIVRPKTVICIIFGVIQAYLLAMAHAHYSVDMILAIIIGMLTLTNHSIKVLLVRMNPFLREMINEEERFLLHHSHESLKALATKNQGTFGALPLGN